MSVALMSAPRPVRSGTDRVIVTIAVATLGLALFQIALGASPMMVAALVGTTLISLAPVKLYGLSHLVGLLYFVVCLYFGFSALLVPTLAARPADVGLFTPDFSAGVVFIFAAAAAMGGLLPRLLFPRLPLLFRPIVSHYVLRRLAIIMFGLGVLGAAANVQGGMAKAAGAFLSSYLILGFLLEMAATLLQSNNRRSLSGVGFVILTVIVVSSVMANSKAGLFVGAGAWVVANLAFGRRISGRMIVAILVVAVIVTYMFLAINIVRVSREEVGGFELLIMTVDTALGLVAGDPQTLANLDKLMADSHGFNMLSYSVIYYEGLPVLVERFILLPYADAILRSIPPDGPFAGLSFITSQFSDLLPVFLNPDKQMTYVGNAIVIQLGLGSDAYASHPTLGLSPELFYAGGYIFVGWGSFVLFAMLSIVLTCVGGRVPGNVFSAYLFVRYVHFLAGGTTTTFLFFIFRQLPVDIVVFFLTVWFISERRRGGGLASPRAS